MNKQIVSYDRSEETQFSDDQIIAMYLSAHDRSPYTYRNYNYAIEQFRMFIGMKRLRDATWREVEAFKIALYKGVCGGSGKPKSPATVAGYIAPLRSLYKWGSDANIGLFPGNPTSCIRSPKVDITSKNHYLTKDELAELLMQLKKMGFRDYLLGLTLVMLGLRVSEVVQIKGEDFHKDPAGISTWLTVVKGKGGKSREVKVPAILGQLLQKHMNEERNMMQDGRVFPLTDRQVERIIQRARENARLTKKVTPHWLRHTHATMALLFGASIQQVQDHLGHVQINTTQRYLHTVDLVKKAASDYVEDGIIDII